MALRTEFKNVDAPLTITSNDGSFFKTSPTGQLIRVSVKEEFAIFNGCDDKIKDYYQALKDFFYWKEHEHTNISVEFAKFMRALSEDNDPNQEDEDGCQINKVTSDQKKTIVDFSIFLGHLSRVNPDLASELAQVLRRRGRRSFLAGVLTLETVKRYAKEIDYWRDKNYLAWYYKHPDFEGSDYEYPSNWGFYASMCKEAFESRRQAQEKFFIPSQLFDENMSDTLSLAWEKLKVAQSNYRIAQYDLAQARELDGNDLLKSRNIDLLRRIFQEEDIVKLTGLVSQLSLHQLCRVFRHNPAADHNLIVLWPSLTEEQQLALVEVLDNERLFNVLRLQKQQNLQEQMQKAASCFTLAGGKNTPEGLKLLDSIHSKMSSTSGKKAPLLLELTYRAAALARSPLDRHRNNSTRYVSVVRKLAKHSDAREIACFALKFLAILLFVATIGFLIGATSGGAAGGVALMMWKLPIVTKVAVEISMGLMAIVSGALGFRLLKKPSHEKVITASHGFFSGEKQKPYKPQPELDAFSRKRSIVATG